MKEVLKALASRWGIVLLAAGTVGSVLAGEATSVVRIKAATGRSGSVTATSVFDPRTDGAPPITQASDTVAFFQIKAAGVPVGQMTVQLHDSIKPETVRNFLSYVQSGAYSNVFLHRCLSNFIVQGGGYFISDPASPDPMVAYGTVPRFGAISNEYSLGTIQPNEYGSLAMAKLPGNPDSATSEWFFNLADNSATLGPDNNGGYTVFGHVIEQTNYLTGDTNLLDLFAFRAKDQGIVDLTAYYGTNASRFSDLPVNYTGSAAPRYADLFTVEITAPGAPDAVLPQITVNRPAEDVHSILSGFTASGTASDNIGLNQVQFRINGGAWTAAVGTNSWTADISLADGPNVLEFRSVDLQGNASAVVRRTVVFSTDPVAGSYTGLFYETNVVAYETAGSFQLTVNASRSFTATLTLEGADYKLKGQFDSFFRATNAVDRSEGGDLTVEWFINPTNANGQVLGRVSNGTWSSPLLGYRFLYGKSPPPFREGRGQYTVAFGGAADSSVAPGGSGYGLMKVDKSGSVSLKGVLADGTAVSHRAKAGGPDGAWPLYASLYNNRGAIIGWLNFTNLPGADLSGTVTMLKRSGAGSKSYPNGFTNTSSAEGAVYTPPGLVKAVNFTNGIVVLKGGGLTGVWTNAISVNSHNRVQNESTNSLSMNINPSSGQFSGSFIEPGTRKDFHFTGVLNQKRDTGAGYFLNNDNKQSGSVFVAPR